ncbi:MAG: prepilin peptidase CpaA [Candidatus Eremiobacteraeota bacterium]|jgi:prepilin peptidase CpaA|nr:prepilin peptidase CpaA [Candidatus Eremiobacteraeota bacterium]
MTAATTVLLLVTCIAAVTDVRTRRIPNVLTGSAAVAAIAISAFSGPPAVLMCILTIAAAFAVGSVAFSAGWFGGGDVKLIAACCGFAGFPGAISLVLDILIAGAVFALVSAAARGRLVSLVRSTAAVAARGVPAGDVPLPYAVAIAGGSIAFVATALVRL